eukprot:788157-Amphidinium_carterae.1
MSEKRAWETERMHFQNNVEAERARIQAEMTKFENERRVWEGERMRFQNEMAGLVEQLQVDDQQITDDQLN